MYNELALLDRNLQVKEVQEGFFSALNHKINGFCCPPTYLESVREFFIEGVTLATPIDFPLGMADTKVRSHAILVAFRKGANAVDLVCNSNLYHQNKDRFIEDLITQYDLCKDKKISLRLMLEYRDNLLRETKEIIRAAKTIGIQYVFPSTGYRVDNFNDNLIVALMFEGIGINAITNGNIFRKEQYGAIVKSGVFGTRFHSVNALKECIFGVI